MDGTHRPRRGLLFGLLLATAIGLVALSFATGWVVHARHQGGHGLTEIGAVWNAWQGRAWPTLPIGIGAAAAVGLAALVELLRPGRVPSWLFVVGSAVVLGLLGAQLLTLDRRGYASQVVITPGWPVFAGVGLAVLMGICAIAATGWARRAAAMAAATLVVFTVAGVGGRWAALSLAEGDPRSYRPGTYVRAEASGQAPSTLVIGSDTFELQGRWSGSFEGRGLVVVLTDDPACPDARGSYRIFPVGEDGIRWNTIVDLCADGERARDLTSGVWERAG